MFTDNHDNTLFSTDIDLAMEGESRVEHLLDILSDGQLAERIMDAARLAMARHASEVAREFMSDVEAENSTK